MTDNFPPATAGTDLAWYAAYGSNMCAARFDTYLAGGRPPGSARTYPGCRDATAPRRVAAVDLPGGAYFALESQVWTGGMAFLDPTAPGSTPGRGYLVTVDQFADVVAQEMSHPLGRDLPWQEAVTCGRVAVGEGRYETLVCAGWRDGYPVLTFTAPWVMGDVTLTAPSGAYLRMLGSGLAEAHGWDHGTIAEHLASLPGAAGAWTPAGVRHVLDTVAGGALPPH